MIGRTNANAKTMRCARIEYAPDSGLVEGDRPGMAAETHLV
jgi:hypothetical protein